MELYFTVLRYPITDIATNRELTILQQNDKEGLETNAIALRTPLLLLFRCIVFQVCSTNV